MRAVLLLSKYSCCTGRSGCVAVREAAKKGFWNGEPHNPLNPVNAEFRIAKEFRQRTQGFKGIAFDYPYSKDFETMKVAIAKHSLRITDTMANVFEIVSATSENSKMVIGIDGNTVTTLLGGYEGSALLTVITKVKLRSQEEGGEGEGVWVDTNKGPAKVQHLLSDEEIKVLLVEPPKLFVENNLLKHYPLPESQSSKPALPKQASSKPGLSKPALSKQMSLKPAPK